MARGHSANSIVLAVGLLFCAAVAAVVLLKRCQAPRETGTFKPQRSPGLAVDQSSPLDQGALPILPPPAPRIPPAAEPKPAAKKWTAEVSDIFGAKVKGVRIALTRSDGGGRGHLVTSEEGRLEIPDDAWEESFLDCGDFHIPLKALERGTPFQIPGRSAAVFGELAVLPLGWDEARVSLQGQNSWKQAAAADEKIGHRFLFLMPGTYEISDPKSTPLGTAEVRAGQRTTFTMTRWSGIRLNVSYVVLPEKVPSMVTVKIKGLSVGATHPSGWRISLMIGNAQWTYTEYGLAPGVYEVSSDEPDYVFSERFDLVEGKVRTVDVRLLRR
jgi:hypothetical protein